jgi:hypothetical protein
MLAAHTPQKVHSYEQMNAWPPGASAPPHFSDVDFISRTMPLLARSPRSK